jgi:uncharacterized membrane protein YcaP (DUF421 family)
MNRERVEEADILEIIRKNGIFDAQVVEVVVLENDGSSSMLQRSDEPVVRSSLGDMAPPDE